MLKTLRFDNNINIFTDASLVNYNGKSIVCSGYIVVKNNIIIDSNFKVINDSTSEYGELYSVLLGIQASIKYKNLFMEMNLFSDSNSTVNALREFVFKWDKTNDYFIKKRGGIVKYHDLISFIINIVVFNEIPISFYNQRGHLDCNDDNDVNSQINFFKKNNSIDLDIETSKKICYYNYFIDMLTRTNLKKIVFDKNFTDENYSKRKFPIGIVLSEKMLNKYSKLINYDKYRNTIY